jgi:hypothetical protein
LTACAGDKAETRTLVSVFFPFNQRERAALSNLKSAIKNQKSIRLLAALNLRAWLDILEED